MKKKMYWGITTIIVIIGVVGVYFILQPEPEVEKKHMLSSEADNKKSKETVQPIAESSQPSRETKDGFTLEQHGDHFHEVPIAQNETPTVHPAQKNQPEKPEHTSPFTFHKELLESNPVKALRLQAEERGHWSKDHIPPFPPDDTEAQAFARNRYLMHYYESIGMIDTPIWSKAARPYSSQLDIIGEYPGGARRCDLLRIMWTDFDAGYITPYGGMTRYGRARLYPSDYFPGFIDVQK